jgi:hypothetical protein
MIARAFPPYNDKYFVQVYVVDDRFDMDLTRCCSLIINTYMYLFINRSRSTQENISIMLYFCNIFKINDYFRLDIVFFVVYGLSSASSCNLFFNNWFLTWDWYLFIYFAKNRYLWSFIYHLIYSNNCWAESVLDIRNLNASRNLLVWYCTIPIAGDIEKVVSVSTIEMNRTLRGPLYKKKHTICIKSAT